MVAVQFRRTMTSSRDLTVTFFRFVTKVALPVLIVVDEKALDIDGKGGLTEHHKTIRKYIFQCTPSCNSWEIP